MAVVSRLLLAFLCGMFMCITYAGATSRSCESAVRVEAAASYGISVPLVERTARKIKPEFFGFNLEWIGFQTSFWDTGNRRILPVVVENLKAFPGAVYRYPGGGAANFFLWSDAVGQPESRPKKKIVDWLAPIAVEFGFDEYLSFVRSVDGKPWVVLNLYGTREGEIAPNTLLDNARDWIDYAKVKEQTGAGSVMRWELGNELDRGPRKSWPPDKYVRITSLFGHAIKAAYPSTRMVAMLQDWKAQAVHTISDYNKHVVVGLHDLVDEYAHHIYFDAPPHAPNIEHRFSLICQTLSNTKKAGIENPSIWITEYGRDIPHAYDGSPAWKRLWSKTANLEAALGVADALTVATQIPEISGLFIHALASLNGPWPLFHAGQNGKLQPSVVFLTLRLLRDGLLSETLETHVRSANKSGYEGGYDLRATVLTNEKRDRYAVWAINRSPQAIEVDMLMAAMVTRRVTALHRFISGDTLEANSYATANRISIAEANVSLSFDAKGIARIVLPPYSISTIEFSR